MAQLARIAVEARNLLPDDLFPVSAGPATWRRRVTSVVTATHDDSILRVHVYLADMPWPVRMNRADTVEVLRWEPGEPTPADVDCG